MGNSSYHRNNVRVALPLPNSGQRPTRPIHSLTAVDDDIIAVSSAGSKSGGSATEIFKIVRMLRRKNVVRQKDASMIQHARDVSHREGLLEAVVVNEDVCGNDKIETFVRRQVKRLRDDVRVVRPNVRGMLRANRHSSGNDAAERGG